MALARKEKVKQTVYVSRILRLTLLAPDIQEAILFGEHPRTLTLADLMAPFPRDWDEQRKKFGFILSA